MTWLNKWFAKSEQTDHVIEFDMHNHVLFGIDDGAKTIDDALAMCEQFIALGYKKISCSPHIMSDYYRNGVDTIEPVFQALQLALKERDMPLELAYAAEYYMDDVFMQMVKQRQPLLSFNGQYVLVETSFLNKPMFFEQLLFDIKTAGYIPVLAHPERYVYLQERYDLVEDIVASGTLLQINLLSLAGFYSPNAKKLAEWLIKEGHYQFLGSDAHSVRQMQVLKSVLKGKALNKVNWQQVLNARL
jgi:tyrosine-protein phosphatase YwqE